MTQTVMNLEDMDPLNRFDAALDTLEKHVAQVCASDGEEAEADGMAALQEQVRLLTEERDRLLAALEAERARVQRLKSANVDVSDRLEAVMGTLKDLSPVMQGQG
ncbi:MAG: DUF4164 family protein [Pseudomonadota bacterium]